ncbi:hypothetical protein L1987_07079 [Smallanthus sonchifolius]|uniref:Uncharacterized protein n=1 Tax=Smallanthus sonchifolius TaxID=185202 RepID=A0ACB9K038_9ASTR|nr:hypothetical protein L1987_07079 [Smallanthus sonchifolius]
MFMMQPIKTLSNTEHFQYDVCNCKTCLEEADRVEYDEDVPKKKKGSQKSLKKRYKTGDLRVSLLGEPSGKFDYYVLYGDSPLKSKPKPCKPSLLKTLPPSQPKGMFMITPSPSTSEYKA